MGTPYTTSGTIINIDLSHESHSMSDSSSGEKQILPTVTYECVRCGTRVTGAELSKLPSPTCAKCGFRVFKKVGDRVPKNLKGT
jgi:DNA-directed RNA polymerase subunit P